MGGVEILRLDEGFFPDPVTGWSAYPFIAGFGGESGTDLRGVHIVEIRPGQVRGNHYHPGTNELLFVFHGEGTFYWEDDDGLHERRVDDGRTLITIPAGVRHALRNTGNEPLLLIAARDGAFDPSKPDVVRTVIA